MARKQISGNKQMLKLLLKEVVEQIDEEHLAKLMEGYRAAVTNRQCGYADSTC
jgi:phage gp16-like protein